MADFKPHKVFLNGDIADCYAVSRYDKDPKRMLQFQGECDAVNAFLRHVRGIVGEEAEIVFIEGNHENRIHRMLLQHPELSSVRAMHPKLLFGLDELNIRWVGCRETEMYRGVCITHGTKVGKWSGWSAKQQYDSMGVSGISGHCHRSSVYRHRDIGRESIWIENGCLCDLNPSYMDSFPNWHHSITVGEFIKQTNRFQMTLINMPGKKILYNGKLFV